MKGEGGDDCTDVKKYSINWSLPSWSVIVPHSPMIMVTL